MKELLSMMLVMATIVCFSSCSKDDEPPTYSIRCDEMSGYSETLRIFECNSSGDKIYDREIEYVSKGETYTFTASSTDVTKIKIYISAESLFGSYNKWVQRVYILDKNKTTEIVISSSTVVGSKEP